MVAGCGVLGVALLWWAGSLGRPAGAGVPEQAGRAAVVVAAHDLLPERRLAASDLTVRWLAGSLPPGIVGSLDGAVGRYPTVPVAAGAALAASELAPAAPVDGRVNLRLALSSDRLDPSAVAGTAVAVVASLDDAGGHRVAVVGTATVESVATGAPPDNPGGSATGADAHAATTGVDLVLRCDPPTALRVMWAESFARALRVLAVPDGVPLPGPVDDAWFRSA